MNTPFLNLTPINVRDFSTALTLLLAARSKGVQASYHPHGGHAPEGYITPSHTVWMLCDLRQAISIKHEVENAA